MKKIIAIISIVAILLTFVACSKDKDTQEADVQDKDTRRYDDTPKIEVVVSEIEEGGVLVTDNNGAVYRIDYLDGLEVEIDDVLIVNYYGNIKETYPLQFESILGIQKK